MSAWSGIVLKVIIELLPPTLGIEFNPELDWDEREQIFKMSGKIVRTAKLRSPPLVTRMVSGQRSLQREFL